MLKEIVKLAVAVIVIIVLFVIVTNAMGIDTQVFIASAAPEQINPVPAEGMSKMCELLGFCK